MGAINRGEGVGRNAIRSSFTKGVEGTAIIGGALYFGTQAWKHHRYLSAARAAHRRRQQRRLF